MSGIAGDPGDREPPEHFNERASDMETPYHHGIYPCVIQEDHGERAECCMWDGARWLWWEGDQWEPVTDCNCSVIGWHEPVLWNVGEVNSCLRAGTGAAGDVLAERTRQRTKLGWTEAHDDKHTDGFLATLAAVKALCATTKDEGHFEIRRQLSSYFDAYGLVHERIYNGTFRDLLKEAGALIIAEIERIDRAQVTP